jgi:hypothetical protein
MDVSQIDEKSLLAEADRIGKYLVGQAPTPRMKELYVRAHEPMPSADREIGVPGKALQIRLNPCEQALWRPALRSALIMGLVDGGLALIEPASPIRKKIFVMLAILEASPEHCREFLPRPYGPTGFVALGVRMVWAGIKGALGAILVALHKARWAIFP